MAKKVAEEAVPTPRSSGSVDRGAALMDWFQVNSKVLGGVAAIVAVAAVGYWFYLRSQQIRTVNAERSLIQAEQSLQSGNTALATSDLQRVVSRYAGTPAGTQAAMLLAQTDYNGGKYQDGIKALESIVDKARLSEAAVRTLIGDGYSQMGKNADAAKAYERAAQATEFPNEKSYYLAKAARSYTTAGDVAHAKKLWTNLAANDKTGAVSAEAKVRLAELEATPAGKS
jgi:predicted negative regulator of RcsB-dependent stress response